MIKLVLVALLIFSVFIGINDVRAKKIDTSLQKMMSYDKDLLAYDDDDEDWGDEDEELSKIFEAKKDKDKKSKKKKKKKDRKKK